MQDRRKLTEELLAAVGNLDYLETQRILSQLPEDERLLLFTPHIPTIKTILKSRQFRNWGPYDLYQQKFLPLLRIFNSLDQIKLLHRFKDTFPEYAAHQLSIRIRTLKAPGKIDDETYRLIEEQARADISAAFNCGLNLREISRAANQYNYLDDEKRSNIQGLTWAWLVSAIASDTHVLSATLMAEPPYNYAGFSSGQRRDFFMLLCDNNPNLHHLAVHKSYVQDNIQHFMGNLSKLKKLDKFHLHGFNDEDYKTFSEKLELKSEVRELIIDANKHLSDLLPKHFPQIRELTMYDFNDAACLELLKAADKLKYLTKFTSRHEEKLVINKERFELLLIVLGYTSGGPTSATNSLTLALKSAIPEKLHGDFKIAADGKDPNVTIKITGPNDSLQLIKQSFANKEKEIGMELFVFDAKDPTSATLPFPKIANAVLLIHDSKLHGKLKQSFFDNEKTKTIRKLDELKAPQALSPEDAKHFIGLINAAINFKQLENLENEVMAFSKLKPGLIKKINEIKEQSKLPKDYDFFVPLITKAQDFKTLGDLEFKVIRMYTNEINNSSENRELIPTISSADISKAISHFNTNEGILKFITVPSYFTQLTALTGDEKSSESNIDFLTKLSQIIFADKKQLNPVTVTNDAKESMYGMKKILAQLEPVRAVLAIAKQHDIPINIDKEFVTRAFLYREHIGNFVAYIQVLADYRTLNPDTFTGGFQHMHVLEDYLKTRPAILAAAASKSLRR